MTPDEKERMYILCGRVVEEKDSVRLLQLVNELNNLLDRKEHHLERATAPKTEKFGDPAHK